VTELAGIVRAAILAVAALMPIVNPLGSAPIFLSMAADLSTAARRQLSRRVAWNSFACWRPAMSIGSHVLVLLDLRTDCPRGGRPARRRQRLASAECG
jgi:small neutral amino acid transporter SnatA (MarC family)